MSISTPSASSTPSFGPSALATPANAITVGRLLLSFPVLVMIADDPSSWGLWVLWTVLCATDGIDGYLARRQGTTRSGAFLDPLADKVLVLGAMFMLVRADVFWWLPVSLVAARELVIFAFRSYWGRRGLAVPASTVAKVKTVAQELAVGAALLPLTVGTPSVATALLWFAVALTVFSGGQYLVAGRRATRLGGSH